MFDPKDGVQAGSQPAGAFRFGVDNDGARASASRVHLEVLPVDQEAAFGAADLDTLGSQIIAKPSILLAGWNHSG